jgi:hypothetical protein
MRKGVFSAVATMIRSVPVDRNSVGDMPVTRRNARAKLCELPNPVSIATDVTEASGSAKRCCASAMRSRAMVRATVSPVIARQMRWKWNGDTFAASASSSNDGGSSSRDASTARAFSIRAIQPFIVTAFNQCLPAIAHCCSVDGPDLAVSQGSDLTAVTRRPNAVHFRGFPWVVSITCRSTHLAREPPPS